MDRSCPPHFAVQYVRFGRVEVDAQRKRQGVDASVSAHRSSQEDTRDLHSEATRRKSAGNHMKSTVLFSGSVRRPDVQPHVANGARKHQAPRSRHQRPAIDRQRARGRREHRSGEGRAHDRSRKSPCSESCCSGDALRSGRVICLEEASDEARPKDEADAIVFPIVANPQCRPAFEARVVRARGTNEALRPCALRASHAEVAGDRAHGASRDERRRRRDSVERPSERGQPSHVRTIAPREEDRSRSSRSNLAGDDREIGKRARLVQVSSSSPCFGREHGAQFARIVQAAGVAIDDDIDGRGGRALPCSCHVLVALCAINLPPQ